MSPVVTMATADLARAACETRYEKASLSGASSAMATHFRSKLVVMNKCAVIIIDMQKAYFHNDELRRRQETLVQRCNKLITTVKGLGLAVCMVRTEHARDQSSWTLNMLADEQGYLFADSPDSELVDGLVADGTQSVIKTRDSAFYGTNLDEILAKHGIDTVVLAGVSTHSCVLMSAADAYARNIHVILARDAIASHDMTYHQSTLAMLQQEYRQECLSADEIEARLNSQAELSKST